MGPAPTRGICSGEKIKSTKNCHHHQFHCDQCRVQPTELQPASAESSREAATSVAEPGSSRQEKCKKIEILTFSEKTGYDINVCDFSVLSVFQIVKFQNGDCPASDGNRGVCFTGLFLLQDHSLSPLNEATIVNRGVILKSQTHTQLE